jgi:hypothetical protein
MGRAKQIILSTISFDNKGKALAFFKAILNGYVLGDKIQDRDAQHLKALLSNHPECSAKTGIGVDYFEVVEAEYGTRCFCIVRPDGSKENFSYIKCINACTSLKDS